MSLVYTLKLICDLAFYLTFAGLICYLATGESLMGAAVYLAGSALISGFLYDKNKLKYAGLVLLFPAIYAVRGNFLNYIFLLPACAYSVYYVNSLPFEITRMEYADIFNLFLKISIPTAFVSLLTAAESFEAACIPYAVVFLLLSITLMRMLRHDKSVLEEFRFKVVNSLSVIGVLAMGVLISSEVFLNAVGALLKAFYFGLIAPVLTLLLTIFLYMIWPLIALLDADGEMKISLQELSVMSGEEILGNEVAADPGVGYEIVKFIIYAGLLALGIFLLYLLFKRLTKVYRPYGDAPAREERIFLNREREVKRPARPANQIRRIYKSFMKICLKSGIVLNPGTTTEDIAFSSGNVFGEKDNAYILRNIYINSRYGEKPPTKEDVKECRHIYNIFRKKNLY